ncbi:EboA domain-containing protein [Saccharothrix sp. S26]|uniref:EboA domain-containing protein n=1 Tax=Saccharothrix sp. S26 TaxID=2907215 RepID=UPI001F34D8AC|nr:EboA domain-containing protein [Saccharothrix sp. S26]MCE6998714.1 EboA domain-containing protein [Saccharothrix sp. S26]
MTFHLGYGTNGFADHRLDDALSIIAGLGYTAVEVTLDHHLDPFAVDIGARTGRLAARLSALGLRAVVEAGSRHLREDREGRVDFLVRAKWIAADLGAGCVSFRSGAGSAADREQVKSVLATALDGGPDVPLALEPEPGMAVARLDEALRLCAELGHPEPLGVTVDVGHCVAVEWQDAAACLRRAGGLLRNVHLDDMLPGVHEHLEFGEGRLDLPDTLAALTGIGYTGVAAVELPRHSRAAPVVASRAFESLRTAHWLARAEQEVRSDPSTIRTLFPAVGRAVRAGVCEARTRLLIAYVDSCDDAAEGLAALYRHGTSAERLGVLRSLAGIGDRVPHTGVELVEQALRGNEAGLVAAAMGPFAARHLDQRAWRHGVLKCLLMGIPLTVVSDLDRRADDELRRGVSAFADERRATGRSVPGDVLDLLATSD